jgi:Protein of unknown function (DUF3618)
MTTGDHGSRSAAPPAANADLEANSAPAPDVRPGDDTTEITTHADSLTGPPESIQDLEQEIVNTRAQLGDTVQQLAAKADVTARARDKAVELTQKVKGKAGETQARATASAASARSQIAEKTEAARQQVLPVVSAGKDQLQAHAAAVGAPAWEATPEPIRKAVAKGVSNIRQRRAPMAAASALVAACLVVRWRRRR